MSPEWGGHPPLSPVLGSQRLDAQSKLVSWISPPDKMSLVERERERETLPPSINKVDSNQGRLLTLNLISILSCTHVPAHAHTHAYTHVNTCMHTHTHWHMHIHTLTCAHGCTSSGEGRWTENAKTFCYVFLKLHFIFWTSKWMNL